MCRILFEISSEFTDMKIFATGATCCHCTSCCNCCCCCCCCCSCCVSIFSDFSTGSHALCVPILINMFTSHVFDVYYTYLLIKHRYSFIKTQKLIQNYSSSKKLWFSVITVRMYLMTIILTAIPRIYPAIRCIALKWYDYRYSFIALAFFNIMFW